MTVTSKSLQPNVVNLRISRLKVINTSLQTIFGTGPGGPNVRPVGTRTGAYDIYDDTREVAEASRPGAPATPVDRNPVGRVFYSVPRASEKVTLLYEQLHQLRQIGGQAQDDSGAVYTGEQEQYVRQRVANLREFQMAAMMRGSYTYTRDGDKLTHGFSGGGETIDFRIPSTNKSQLDMLGGGNILTTVWTNAAATIITDCYDIDDAFVELTGRGLRHVFLNSATWRSIPTNTQVINEAGTSNPPVQITQADDNETRTATLTALPGVTFHINNNRVNLGGTATKLFANNAAVFTTELDSQIARYMETGEPVAEWEGRPKVVRFGEYYFAKELTDPDRVELHSRFNGLPELLVPKAIAYGTVAGF